MAAVIAYGLACKRPRYWTKERETYLRENSFVAIEILAADINLCYRDTYAMMRKMGLRKCRSSRDRR